MQHIKDGGATRADASCYVDAFLYGYTAVIEVQDLGFVGDQETSHFLRHISEAVNCTMWDSYQEPPSHQDRQNKQSVKHIGWEFLRDCRQTVNDLPLLPPHEQ